jgi:hypothetical protein
MTAHSNDDKKKSRKDNSNRMQQKTKPCLAMKQRG